MSMQLPEEIIDYIILEFVDPLTAVYFIEKFCSEYVRKKCKCVNTINIYHTCFKACPLISMQLSRKSGTCYKDIEKFYAKTTPLEMST